MTAINALVEQALGSYTVADPSAAAPLLARGLKATNDLLEQVKGSSLSADAKYNIAHELTTKQGQFNDAITLALGLSVAATVTSEPPPPPAARGSAEPANDEERAAAAHMAAAMRARGDQPTFPMAIPGQRFPVLVHLAEGSAVPVKIDKVSLELEGADASAVTPQGSDSGQLSGGAVMNAVFNVQIPETSGYTRPYFERPGLDQPYYDLRDPRYRNLPFAPYPLQARVVATYEGVQLHLSETVQAVEREAGPGIVYHPLPIGPAISVTMIQSAGIIPLGKTAFSVKVRIHSDVNSPAKGSIRLDMPAGWKSEPATEEFSFEQEGQEQIVAFNVSPGRVAEKAYRITAVASYNNHEYKEGYVQVGYPGLRPYFLYSNATYDTAGTKVNVGSNLAGRIHHGQRRRCAGFFGEPWYPRSLSCAGRSRQRRPRQI